MSGTIEHRQLGFDLLFLILSSTQLSRLPNTSLMRLGTALLHWSDSIENFLIELDERIEI